MQFTLLQSFNRPDFAVHSPSSIGWLFGGYWFSLLVFILLIIFFIRYIRKQGDITKNWSYLIQDATYSSKETYQKIAELLKEQGISKVRMSSKNINTGGVLTGKRIYLKVTWHEYDYYICASPFGNSFFVSYWGLTRLSFFVRIVSSIPLLGGLLVRLFAPTTFYKRDTDTMFHTLVHQCVVDVVEDMMKDLEKAPLSEQEKTPRMKDPFAR